VSQPIVPPARLQITPAEVHLWQAALDVPPARADRLAGGLAPDERQRADAFHFERDRVHFIAARAFLREVLGRYLGRPAPAVQFRYSPSGKPEVEADSPLQFNLSHSGGLALLAVAQGRAVGMDVERLRPDFAGEPLARRFFAPGEVAALLALPEYMQLQAFYRCWTRKEAYLKARGDGLSFPLDQFEVTLTPGEPARLLRVQGDEGEATRWHLEHLEVGADYVATLAVAGHDWRLVRQQAAGWE
jgi:4'-phosphopantetheinyl transferase